MFPSTFSQNGFAKKNKKRSRLISPIFIFLYLCCYFNYLNIYLLDSVNDYDVKRNTEIMKWNANVENGILGMRRDINLQLLQFFHSYDDIKEVLINFPLLLILILLILLLLLLLLLLLNTYICT
jgi:hypothetical protein